MKTLAVRIPFGFAALILLFASLQFGGCSLIRDEARAACEKFIEAAKANRLQEAVSLLHPNATTADFLSHKFGAYELVKKEKKDDKRIYLYELVRGGEKVKYTFTTVKSGDAWVILSVE